MGHIFQGEFVPRTWEARMEKAEQAPPVALPYKDSASRLGP